MSMPRCRRRPSSAFPTLSWMRKSEQRSPLKPGGVIAEELRDHVKANVAAYKCSRHVWFVLELPQGPTGKIPTREITPAAELAGAATGGL